MQVKFDQHFLENKFILNKEISILEINSKDIIVEIGPGKCALTKLILENNPKKLISIEMDEELENNLKEIQKTNKIFTYIMGNSLDKIKELKFDKLISNIPYSITEPLYKYLMKNKIKYIILLQGEKFYKQILSKTSKWHYFINSFYDIKLIEEVEGNNFNPKTKVKSVLLKLEFKKNPTDKEIFFQQLFLRSNRNIKNALIYSLVEIGKTKTEAKLIINQILKELKIDENKSQMKLENITNKLFVKIIEKL